MFLDEIGLIPRSNRFGGSLGADSIGALLYV